MTTTMTDTIIDALAEKARTARREQLEPFALTDATHSRSTHRYKTSSQKSYENGLIDGLCDALHRLGWNDVRTPEEARMRIMEQVGYDR